MNRSTQRLSATTLALLAAAAGAASVALPAAEARAGHTAIALTTDNRLLRFDTDSPGSIQSDTAVTGLAAGESLLGIDFRPATGQLYGLGSSSRLYTIDRATGTATQVGSGTFVIPLSGDGRYGFDFNPVPDRIRVVGEALQDNLRLHPDTGAVVDADPATDGVQADGSLAYNSTDANAGVNPGASSAAYSNNDTDASTGTTLYVIDNGLKTLAIQNPPNAGTLNTVGPLGVDASMMGFDIVRADEAFTVNARRVDGDGNVTLAAQLFTIDLASGAATSVGNVGDGSEALRGLAVTTIPLPAAAWMFPLGAAAAGWYAHRMRRRT